MDGTDWEVIARFQAGDGRALGEIIKRYTPRLERHLMKMFSRMEADVQYDTVQDILQEVWIRVDRYVAILDHTKVFSTWIYTVATNLGRNKYRDLRVERRHIQRMPVYGTTNANDEFEVEDTSHSSRPDIMCEERDLLERLACHLNTEASREQVELLGLRETRGKSYSEMAAQTGVSIGTVKSRLNRARKTAQTYRLRYG